MLHDRAGPTKVLDFGYVSLIETWGSDERIVESARMSTNKSFNGWGPIHREECELQRRIAARHDPEYHCICHPKAGDEKLLRYLWTNHHATPFEMAGATFEVQAPIFVFREWHRHRTQSYSELSARYSPLPEITYLPTVERCLMTGGTNKQASSLARAPPLTARIAQDWLNDLQQAYDHVEKVYRRGLDIGIPKEIARCPLPVARYSRMRASTDLRNWFGFLTLRMDSHAQLEIRQFACAVGDFLKTSFPRRYALFEEGFKR